MINLLNKVKYYHYIQALNIHFVIQNGEKSEDFSIKEYCNLYNNQTSNYYMNLIKKYINEYINEYLKNDILEDEEGEFDEVTYRKIKKSIKELL